MVTEGFVTAIMEASLTGAGLVLAVFALVAPLSRRIDRIKMPKENLLKLRHLMLGIVLSLLATFFLYMISGMMAYGWLSEPPNQTVYGIFMQIFFLIANSMFMVYGGCVAALIYMLMQRESDSV
jgi:hypothetical protein